MNLLETAAQIGIITRDDANAALWFFRGSDEALDPGDGMLSILRAFAAVDADHRRRLRGAYPSLGAAYEIGARDPRGIEVLREIANAKHRATLEEIADDHAAMGRAS